MNPRNRNIWLVIVLTCAAAGIIFLVSKSEPIENKSFFQFPLKIGDWTGQEVSMGSYVYSSLATKYVFLRNYYSPRYKHPVNFSVIWFDDRNFAFHAPEACLGGVGNTVTEKSVVRLTIDKEYNLGKLLVREDNAEYLVLYYFDADGCVTTSQTEIRLKALSRRLRFKRSSASFVRLMVLVEPDKDVSLKQVQDFLGKLLPLLPAYTHTDIILKQPE